MQHFAAFILASALLLAAASVGATEVGHVSRTELGAGKGSIETLYDRSHAKVQEVHKDAKGRITKVVRHDPKSGATTTTTFRDGKPESSTTVDRDGHTTRSAIHDENGRPSDVQTQTPDGRFESHTRYDRDAQGRVTRETKYDDVGNEIEETTHLFGEDGTRVSTRWRLGPRGARERLGEVIVDGNGTVISADGQTAGLLPRREDPNTHVTTDGHGNEWTITHNPDGTFDVVVVNARGIVISLQHLRPGDCPLQGDCPHERRRRARVDQSAALLQNMIMRRPTALAQTPVEADGFDPTDVELMDGLEEAALEDQNLEETTVEVEEDVEIQVELEIEAELDSD